MKYNTRPLIHFRKNAVNRLKMYLYYRMKKNEFKYVYLKNDQIIVKDNGNPYLNHSLFPFLFKFYSQVALDDG